MDNSRRCPQRIAVLTPLFVLMLSQPLAADTIIFGDAVGAAGEVEDVTVFSGDFADDKWGSSDKLWAGTWEASGIPAFDGRSVLRFDVSELFNTEPNAVVTAVTLKLETIQVQDDEDDYTVAVHAVHENNEGWVEGDATWNHKVKSTSTAWHGGAGLGTTGYDSTALAQQTFDTATLQSFSFSGTSTELTNLLKGWDTQGSDNAGVILLMPSPNDNTHRVKFASKEHDTLAGPILEVTYIPEPGSVVLLLSALAGLGAVVGRRRR